MSYQYFYRNYYKSPSSRFLSSQKGSSLRFSFPQFSFKGNKVFDFMRNFSSRFKKPRKIKVPSKKVLLGGGVVLTFLVIGLLLVRSNLLAVVNGEMISKKRWTRYLQTSFGPQALDELVDAVLVEQEAKKNKASLSKEEIEERTAGLKNQFDSEEAFQKALKSQGFTEERFKAQVRLQLLVEKTLTDKITPQEGEVLSYYNENKSKFTKKEGEEEIIKSFEEAREDVELQLKKQNLAQVFPSWIEELRQKAKIYKKNL